MWMELLYVIVGFLGVGLSAILVIAIFAWLMNKIDSGPGFRR